MTIYQFCTLFFSHRAMYVLLVVTLNMHNEIIITVRHTCVQS